MKGVSLPKSLNALTRNKVVLYAVLALAIVNLLGYLSQNNLTAIGIFLVIGFGMTYITKNMVYVLLIALVVTNMVSRPNMYAGYGLMEGMDRDDTDATGDTGDTARLTDEANTECDCETCKKMCSLNGESILEQNN